MGEALAPFRNLVVIATKFGLKLKPNGEPSDIGLDSTPTPIQEVAEESLNRLNVDALDVCDQHRVEKAVPSEEVAGAVKDLIAEGTVKDFGLSEAGPETIWAAWRSGRKQHRRRSRWDGCWRRSPGLSPYQAPRIGRGWSRILGAAAVELSPDELSKMQGAAADTEVRGARYPQHN